MKKIITASLFAVGTTFCLSASTFAAQTNCITFSDARNQSETYPDVDASQLPPLPAGWTWQKEYSDSAANPDAWQWVSWPDGTTLQICSAIDTVVR